MIVLDTTVLSLAFRRRPSGAAEPPAAQRLRRLIQEDAPLNVPGIVLQELLSGVRSEAQFHILRAQMEGFPLLLAEEADHVRAATIANACRRKGLVASTIDCLIAALTIAHKATLWTTDTDFQQIARHTDLKLMEG